MSFCRIDVAAGNSAAAVAAFDHVLAERKALTGA
jgi:hypothetical protein